MVAGRTQIGAGRANYANRVNIEAPPGARERQAVQLTLALGPAEPGRPEWAGRADGRPSAQAHAGVHWSPPRPRASDNSNNSRLILLTCLWTAPCAQLPLQLARAQGCVVGLAPGRPVPARVVVALGLAGSGWRVRTGATRRA